MRLRFDDLPEADDDVLRVRQRPRTATRRRFLANAFGVATAAGLGAFALLNTGASRAQAAYFQDYTDPDSGPCADYARFHTESGVRCGPSTPCDSLTCCWKYRDGAGNQVGWHKSAPGPSGYYLHRPDACWGGTYDSWRWRFSDGRTYRCSDGWTCSPSGSCFRSICPWPL